MSEEKIQEYFERLMGTAGLKMEKDETGRYKSDETLVGWLSFLICYCTFGNSETTEAAKVTHQPKLRAGGCNVNLVESGEKLTGHPVHISQEDGVITIHIPERNLMVNISDDNTVSYSDKSNGYYANSGKDAIKRESVAPYLHNRADGVDGHYCIARHNPKGFTEFYEAGKWVSATSLILHLGKSNESKGDSE